MALSRHPEQTLGTIRGDVREELRDPTTDAAGNTINSTRWTNTQVDRAIAYQISQMATQMTGAHVGESLVKTAMTYTGGAEYVSLPAGIGANEVYRIDDLTQADYPVELEYVHPNGLERFGRHPILSSARTRRRYTLVANDDSGAPTHAVAVRPKPEGDLSLAIWHLAPAITGMSFGEEVDDTHPLTSRWREVLALGAALKLLRVDDEASPTQIMQYQQLWAQFTAHSNRQRGPMRVRRKRRGL